MSGDRREAVEAVVQAHLAGLIAALYSAPDAAMLTVAQVEAVSAYAARQHLALLDERDALAAKVARVGETAQILGRFDCLDDYVPPTVDVPDDYEAGVLDAVKSFRLALKDHA